MDTHVAHALIRFGLGRRGQEATPSDPVAWLRAQVRGPDTARFDPSLPTAAEGLTQLREQNRMKIQGLVQPLFEAHARAQTELLLTTGQPFRERLVQFWANHFTVSLRQGGTRATVGPFVKDAIRPHVTGPFFAMLLEVMRHPAMIMYLDNQASFGPTSVRGLRDNKGLNENLARECLELHTVSPASGYTQADVTSFAKVLTGWSVDLQRLEPGYQFRPFVHEPGDKTVLGRRFPEGEAGGIAALQYLAHHPATYRHLATKLVGHFVSDTPPPDAVRTIEGVLRDTGGDLGEATLALIDLRQAWTPLAKLRTPQDFAVATLRALDLPPDKMPPLQGAFANLGQPLWNAKLPDGYKDTAEEWVAPEALVRRIDWTHGVAGRADRDAAEVAQSALGPLLRPSTAAALRTAGSRRDALTLLLTSPEFMRR